MKEFSFSFLFSAKFILPILSKHQILPQCCIFNMEYLFLYSFSFLQCEPFIVFHATFIFSTVQIRHMYVESLFFGVKC